MGKWEELLNELREAAVIPENCTGLRPFVCDRFPCQSEAILIGENPATKLQTNWWDFWDEVGGFKYEEFAKKYHEVRPKISPTRRNLAHFRKHHGIPCVETNVYCNEAERGEEEEKVANDRVVEVLLENMPKLRAVVIHGAKARKFIGRDRRGQGISEALQPLVARGIKIFHMCHLCNAGYGCIDTICDWIKANRLDKCPRCGSNSPSQCMGNGPAA